MFDSSPDSLRHNALDDVCEMEELSFSFAFQPIVEDGPSQVLGYEALIRGVAGQPASTVLATIRPENRERFDQAIRLRAIREAGRLGIRKPLHLNCSWLNPENTRAAMVGMLNVAAASGLRREDLVLELQNLEQYRSLEALDQLRQRMKEFRVPILADQFGAGEADLTRLAVLRPELVKLDRGLITGIHQARSRQAIVSGIVAMSRSLGIRVVALGVEELAELNWLKANGVRLFQGYYFAKPAMDQVPAVRRSSASSGSDGFSEMAFAAAAY